HQWEGSRHALFLMCDDIHAFLTEMQKRTIDCGPVQDQGWGVLTEVTLPSGGKLHVYQPRQKRPKPARSPAAPSLERARHCLPRQGGDIARSRLRAGPVVHPVFLARRFWHQWRRRSSRIQPKTLNWVVILNGIW